jgi:hypothetical protein
MTLPGTDIGKESDARLRIDNLVSIKRRPSILLYGD